MSYFFWLGRDGEMAKGGRIAPNASGGTVIVYNVAPVPGPDCGTLVVRLIRADMATRTIQRA